MKLLCLFVNNSFGIEQPDPELQQLIQQKKQIREERKQIRKSIKKYDRNIKKLEERLRLYEIFTKLGGNIKNNFGEKIIFAPLERKNNILVFLPDNQRTNVNCNKQYY